jgi:ABC-2 type transport system ATP-binding protein
MAQETSIDLELTPRENLQTACEIYGVDQATRNERIEELLNLVDLQDVADKRAETFSGGMQKRLDAATVLVHRPPVVFLDEPTTGLDPEARLRVWEYFEAINDRGTTVFLTTQYLEEADQLCDRLAILEDGEIIAAGTPQTLKAETGLETVRVRLANTEQKEQAKTCLQSAEYGAVERTADGVSIETADAHGVASEVVLTLAEEEVCVEAVDIQTPTLDDVFLALTDTATESTEMPQEVAG